MTSPAVGAKAVAEFMDRAKRQPRRLNVGSAGQGSSLHRLGEMRMSDASRNPPEPRAA